MHRSHSLAIVLAAVAMLLPADGAAQRGTSSPELQRSAQRIRPEGAATVAQRSHTSSRASLSPTGNASVTLVLVPKLDARGASAVIMRRASQQPRNIILVTPATTAADLSKAVAALFRSRRRQGDEIRRDLLARVAPAEVAGAGDAVRSRARAAGRSKNLAQAERHLAALRSSPRTLVEGVGTHPARTVTLGPLRR